MSEVIPFLLNHWILSSVFLLVLGGIIYLEMRRSGASGALKLSTQQAVQLINREHALVVDIRARNLYLAGHIASALNILPEQLPNHKRLADDRHKPIILLCSNGQQSPALAVQLIQQGFAKMHYIAGGMLAWESDNLPTIK